MEVHANVPLKEDRAMRRDLANPIQIEWLIENPNSDAIDGLDRVSISRALTAGSESTIVSLGDVVHGQPSFATKRSISSDCEYTEHVSQACAYM